jgi:hypothetical protein
VLESSPEERKRCPDCGDVKPLSEFPRNKHTRSGFHAYCKPCHNARTRDTVRRLYGNSRHYHLRKKYGVGSDEVQELVKAQGGVCPICLKRPATQVDHDHDTGEIRGVLCLYCNAALGAFHDDPDLIAKAIAYVERHRA